MRTYTLLTRSIVILSAFTAGCADAPGVTSPDNSRLGGRRDCVTSNTGTADCSTATSSSRLIPKPSASVAGTPQALGGVGLGTFFEQPTTEYVQGTTKIDISALTDLTFYSFITDGAQTVSFQPALERRTVPSTYSTWSSPPESESATPPVLFHAGQPNIEFFQILTLSQPAAVVGFELEPDQLAGASTYLVEFYTSEYKLLGFTTRTVEGNGGARVFAFAVDGPDRIARVDISGQDKFAIAQVRYSLNPFPSVIPISIDIKPGTSPNDVKLGAKGRLPVAVLTTPTFDAATIDIASVTLGNEAAQDTPIAQLNKGTPMASLQDVDADGDLDLILQFDIPALVANGDLTAATTQLVLKGTLVGGAAVRTVDNVTLKP